MGTVLQRSIAIQPDSGTTLRNVDMKHKLTSAQTVEIMHVMVGYFNEVDAETCIGISATYGLE